MNTPEAQFISGGTTQRIIEVVEYDHFNHRVRVISEPDHTLRWISLDKPRLVAA